MDGDTNKQSELLTTEITENHQTAHPAAATVSSSAGKFQISSDYTRKVDRTTDIAGKLPNAVYTLPPHIVQGIVGLADVTDATREALVAEGKTFYLAHKQYEESKEVFVDGWSERITTTTLDCGRLYSEGNNRHGQCGIGSEEKKVTGPRLIRLPPVLEVRYRGGRWFANTTRGLYAWGRNYNGKLGVGNDDESVKQPRRVPIDGDVMNVSLSPAASFFRTDSGWFGCGDNSYGQLGLGHNDKVTTPTPIPGSEGVTHWRGDYGTTFGFSDGGLLVCGANGDGKCGVGSTNYMIATLTPVALPADVKGSVDRVVSYDDTSFIIAGRRCFAAGLNRYGRLGLGSDERGISTPTELPIPVDDIISNRGMTIIRSSDTLLGFGNNKCGQISTANTPDVTTPTPIDLPGPAVKVVVDWERIFIQLTDGAWVGRGMYDSDYFNPIPEADLIDRHSLPGWTPIKDDYAEVLNSWEAADDVMILSEPITNNQESYEVIYRPAPWSATLQCIAI